MASLHGGCSDFTDGSSSEDGGDPMVSMPNPPSTQAQPPTKTPIPVTMEAIGALMADHHKKIADDVVLLREDIKGITNRLGAVEATSTNHTSQIADLLAAIRDMQQKTRQHEQQLAAHEDKSRRNNIKLRGVADSVPEAELPHFIRRLLTELLNPKAAKATILEEIFRIPRPAKAPPAASGDLILQFQSFRDRKVILEVVRAQPTYPFEGMTLSFYADLSDGTLAWRRSMSPFTALLRLHQIRYRWGPGRTLIIDKEGTKHVIQDMQEATGTLGLLGLPTEPLAPATPSAGQTRPHRRYSASAPEFVPRRPPADSYAKATT
ncbi:Hypothetical predicted protein [Pelobates cultripes]|uniref:Uncharacterized protein n=1 Tax=Pelobates cultripes TaxID=61616 RepID=A0AAD1VZX9_PELCU|nr:Hypothetical predicted protein [Pelobates cultripes]